MVERILALLAEVDRREEQANVEMSVTGLLGMAYDVIISARLRILRCTVLEADCKRMSRPTSSLFLKSSLFHRHLFTFLRSHVSPDGLSGPIQASRG